MQETNRARSFSDSFFVPFTDAKHRKTLGVRTTTRAWAGPRPFDVSVNGTLRVTLSDDAKAIHVKLLKWSPVDDEQRIEVGGWVRLPKLLRDFNPDLAGTIKPLNVEKVRIDVGDFGDRTVDNPINLLFNKLIEQTFVLPLSVDE